jgi:hypothetical protein
VGRVLPAALAAAISGAVMGVDITACRGGQGTCDVCGRRADLDWRRRDGRLVWACAACLSDPRKWVEPRWAGGLWLRPDPWPLFAWYVLCLVLSQALVFAAGYFACLLTRG